MDVLRVRKGSGGTCVVDRFPPDVDVGESMLFSVPVLTSCSHVLVMS